MTGQITLHHAHKEYAYMHACIHSQLSLLTAGNFWRLTGHQQPASISINDDELWLIKHDWAWFTNIKHHTTPPLLAICVWFLNQFDGHKPPYTTVLGCIWFNTNHATRIVTTYITVAANRCQKQSLCAPESKPASSSTWSLSPWWFSENVLARTVDFRGKPMDFLWLTMVNTCR